VELRRLEKDRNPVGKLSFVGYSMGGLVSRYAIGLLYAKGWFEKLECVVRISSLS
jgi:predicted alpha/beta-fold hydrolase